MPKYQVVSDAVEAFRFINTQFKVYASSWQKGIVLQKDGETIAAVLYAEFNGANVFVHLAGTPGRHWLTRDFLYWGFHYPFEQLGCQRITCLVEASNAASQQFCEHIGWTKEFVHPRAASDGGDLISYRMFREDCKHVQERLRRG